MEQPKLEAIAYEDWKLDLITFDSYGRYDNATILWDVSTSLTYQYVSRFFAEASTLLNDISPEELDRILWLIIHDLLNVGADDPPSLALWQDCLNAIKILFRDLYNQHCAPVLGHQDEQPSSPLNSSCYMWWDILPIWHPDEKIRAQVQADCFGIMTYCLSLENLACKESALHGLGHWYSIDPHRVQAIIEQHDPIIPKKLKLYAQNAKCGCVL